ncbi:MAG: NAD(P)/FAD-dependent oxidoreductase [Sulfolobaceae archaeon]
MITIVGSGPAGFYAALTAASLGEKVTVVEERDKLGGTCVLFGCIPSKAMLHPMALAYSLGRIGKTLNFSYLELTKLAKDAINRISKGIEYALESHDIDVIHGKASLKGGKIEVNGQTLNSEKVIIATGTKKPSGALASDDLPYLDKDFNRVVIVGGGVGGVEYGWLLRMIGKEVHIVEREDLLLPKHDPDLRKSITNYFSKLGFKLHMGVEAKIEGNEVITSKGEKIEGDFVLLSFGRKPNLEGFEELRSDKWLLVNEYMETSLKNVYAAGDVTGSFTAHEAIHKGVTAALNSVGKRKAYDGSVVPKVIYTMPQIAYIGKTTGNCKKIDMVTLPRAIAEKETEGFLKICEEGGKIVGAVVFSERAEEIITIIGIAMKFGISISSLLDFQFPHPSYLESIWELVRTFDGIM